MVRCRPFAMGLALVACPAVGRAANIATIKVDLTHAQQGRFHAELDLPAQPGPMTLAYPRWIPGDHAPAGPIENLAGLTISADGTPLPWSRDRYALDTFKLTAPPHAKRLHVSLDFLAVRSTVTAINQAGAATSDSLAILRWHTVLLYPLGVSKATYSIQPSVTLPPGWRFASALKPLPSPNNTEIGFEPVSLEKLVDSPLLAGRNLASYAMSPTIGAPMTFHIAADDPKDTQLSEGQQQSLSRLDDEAQTLFGSHPFSRYDFLLNISPKIRTHRVIGGQEHAASCDCIGGPGVFSHPEARETVGDSLAHEFAHAWNGKYRRPAGEVVQDFQQPYDDDLIWVYEGLTYYFGHTLAARSGFWSRQDLLDAWAETAAEVDNRPGRAWKSLQDTARSLPTLMRAPPAWTSWRRSVDYYPEGGLIWLAVDMQIRELTSDRKSLDDFCKLFFAKGASDPDIKPYDLQEIVATLGKVVPYDWREFLEDRLALAPPTPDVTLKLAGWRLVYDAHPTPFLQEQESDGSVDASYSAGFSVGAKGDVTDVIWNSPAFDAGLGPGMMIVEIEHQPYSGAALRAALDRHAPLVLLIDNAGLKRALRINYSDGQRYPHLEQIIGAPDRLSATGAPRTRLAKLP